MIGSHNDAWILHGLRSVKMATCKTQATFRYGNTVGALCALAFPFLLIVPALVDGSDVNLPDSAYQKGERWWVPPIQAVGPSTAYQVFMSEAAGQEVGYLEFLPPQYNEDGKTRFPVMYWLLGLGGDPSGGLFAIQIYAKAMEEGEVPPFIIISCNGVADTWYLDSEDGEYPVETMIASDLVPHIDATRRTIARSDGRIIEGFSMGGYGAMKFGLKHPEVFGAVGAHGSGRFDRQSGYLELRTGDEPQDSEEARMRTQSRIQSGPLRQHSAEHVAANSAIVLLEQNRDRIRQEGLRVWLAVGGDDWHREGAELFCKRLEESAIPCKVVVAPNIGHNGAAVYDYASEQAFAFVRGMWGSE